MLQQLQMNFDPLTTPKNREHRATSYEAHESVKESKQVHYEKLLKAYEFAPNGLTSEEAGVAAGISYESAHKRIPELISQHKLYNTGILRKNKSGRKAMVRSYCRNQENDN